MFAGSGVWHLHTSWIESQKTQRKTEHTGTSNTGGGGLWEAGDTPKIYNPK